MFQSNSVPFEFSVAPKFKGEDQNGAKFVSFSHEIPYAREKALYLAFFSWVTKAIEERGQVPIIIIIIIFIIIDIIINLV